MKTAVAPEMNVDMSGAKLWDEVLAELSEGDG